MYVIEVEDYDDRRKVVCNCTVCKKQILGPAFKLDGSTKMFFHLSCLHRPINYKALICHFRSGHRPLIFTKELKNEGKEDGDAVCFR
jgi:hypothetical protein